MHCLMLFLLFEIIDESGNALHGFLAAFLYLNDKLYIGLDSTTQVLNFIKGNLHTDALTGKDGLTKAHVLHAIVHHALQVVNLYNLVPHQGNHTPFDAIKIALAILCAMKLEKVLKNGKKKNQNNRA